MKALAARRNHQTAPGKFLKFVLKRTLPRVEDVEIDGAVVAYSKDCFVQRVQHHNGLQLLAAVMDAGRHSAAMGSTNCRGIFLTWQSSRNFAADAHASVRASDIEKEGLCPTANATSPMLVGRDLSFRNWSIYQDSSSRWTGPHGPGLASMGNKLLPALKAGNLEDKIWNFDYPAAAILFSTATDALGLGNMTLY